MELPEIKNKLKSMLDEKRFAHTLCVCEAAVTLAERFGADKNKAYLAALLHDCARGLDAKQTKVYCEENGIKLDEYMQSDPNPIHALVGADMAKRQFGIDDAEILQAIKHHAIGHEDMTLLDKILFVADATEPTRTSFEAAEARRAAKEDIDKATALALRQKILYVESLGRPMHPNSIKMLKKLTECERK
ncbi:MAG: bis(5'-nucleosyl)-tetraphosphatase (symmetrical) YqeK [Defluviitaleaceae bacterium]|nr:bis(5'-nucleosyl)-tetraphosphatase (symmetrical) YqeK [Defluviitaleaceae bacterium]